MNFVLCLAHEIMPVKPALDVNFMSHEFKLLRPGAGNQLGIAGFLDRKWL